MSARSTLMVSGHDIRIEGLDLDGTLIVRAVPGANVHLKNLTVKNRGWVIEPLKEGGRYICIYRYICFEFISFFVDILKSHVSISMGYTIYRLSI